MKEKTLVYGLHDDFIKYRQWIDDTYDIIGYYDADESRLPLSMGIKTSDLKNMLDESEIVLITADPVSILTDLIEIYEVPLEKVRVLFYELSKSSTLKMPFFGSFYEDVALLYLIERIGMRPENLFYLEIGTNDPVRFNNTYALYRCGARGCLVDPISAVGELARMIRPEDQFVNAAVSDKSGDDVVFYLCKSSTVSSLNEEHHAKWEGQSHVETREIKVPLIGINELFSIAECKTDLLLVDAEGYDEIILRGIDFSRYAPSIIMTETPHMESNELDLDCFLHANGYCAYSQISVNRIYIKEELLDD